MKRSNVGSCPMKSDVVENAALHRRNLNSLLRKYFFHQLQSSRNRVFKRGLTHPQNYIRLLALYGTRPPNPSRTTPASNPSIPLDLSLSSRPPRPSSNERPKNPVIARSKASPSNKEPTWRHVALSPNSATQSASTLNSREWFPVDKKPFYEGERPQFYPLLKGKHGSQFPWMNSLNRIFLQEKGCAEGEGSEEKKSQIPIPTAPALSKSEYTTAPSQSKLEKGGSTPTMKSSSLNPFKITPSNSSSWPVDGHENASKPILAPPKFGASPSYGFGKFGSNSGSSILAAPTLSVSSFSETPKSTFKLKPPILGTTPTSSSFSMKRPVSNVDSEGGTDNSPSQDAVTPPDPKRARTSPTTTENTSGSPPPPPPTSEVKNGSPCSSRLSSCSSPSSSSVPNPETKVSSLASSSSLSPPPAAAAVGKEGTSSSSNANSSPKESSPIVPVPVFVPLNTSSTREASSTEESNSSRVNGVGATSPPLSSNVGNAGFIFGQNLENRVSGVSSSATTSLSMRFSNGETNTSTSSSGQNLFTAAANNLATPSSTADGAKSLSESSREFSLKEESLKTKYEEVQIVTGEEGEKNVIQMNCKLYGWSNGSWQERGRGILRLNDREIRDELHSRLVIRTQGTLTVMLNAKIWAEMSVEKPNDKSVRFTASDVDGQPKIYLVMGSPKDITLLHNSLEYRVAAARSQNIDEKERESEEEQDQDSLPSLSV